MRRLPLLIALGLALGLLWVPSAAAQLYDRSTGQSAFTSIIPHGATLLSFSDPDDGTATVSLPFSVDFFGQSYFAGSTLTVSTNGYVTFGSAGAEYQNASIPSTAAPNGLIAGFWDDLELGSGTVHQGVFALNSGEEVLIIEFDGVQIYGQAASLLTFQIWIFESGLEFDVHYGALGGGVFGSASIGIESPSGAEGVAEACTPYCTNQDVVTEQFIAYLPRTGPPPNAADLSLVSLNPPPARAAVGSGFDLSFEARNFGGTQAGAFEVVAVLDQNGFYEASDPVLGRVSVSSGLAAGATATLTLRATIPSQPAGTYGVLLVADPSGVIFEEDRSNNSSSAGNLTVEVSTSNLEILTRTLPPAVVSEAYSHQLEVSGAQTPAWSIVSGDPGPGLSLSPAGVLAGIPTLAGTAAFRVQVYDPSAGTATRDFVLTVVPEGGLRLVSAALPRASVGTPYSARLTASGGTPPYAFLIVSGAPSWLTMRSDGEMSGTPDSTAVHSLEISVADSAGGFSGGTLRLEVVASVALAVTTSALPAGVVGFPYETRLEAAGGQPPYVWSLSTGTLPEGLSLSPDGRISGTPAAEARATLGFRVEDASGGAAMASLALEIEALRPLAITLPARVGLKLREENRLPLTASGGVPPYTWALALGRLPEGVELLVEEGQTYFSGVPTSTVPEAITLVVTDARSESVEAELTVLATLDGSAALPRGGERARREASGCSAQEGEGASSVWLLLGLLGVLSRRRSRPLRRPAKGLNEGRGAAVRTPPHEDRGHLGTGLPVARGDH